MLACWTAARARRSSRRRQGGGSGPDDRTAFFDLYAREDALEGEIDDHAGLWHAGMAARSSGEALPLAARLGRADEGCAEWVEDWTAPPSTLDARSSRVPRAAALGRGD